MRRAEVEAELRDLLARVGRPEPVFTLDLRPRGDGTPHVEGDGPFFELVVDADGAETARETVDGHELVFRIIARATRLMVMAEEERTRTEEAPGWLFKLRRIWPTALEGLIGTDDYSRATWIDAHVRLMTHLRSDWGARVRREHDAVLRKYPITTEERGNRRRLDLSDFGLD